jgi:tetratricopeptide (TPR) repeat protein
MRIALLIDPPAGQAAIDELRAHADSRLVLVPHADRVGHAIAVATRTYGVGGNDVIVVRRVGDGVVSASEWAGSLAGRASELDDDAAVEARIASAFQALQEGRLEEAEEGYAVCDRLLADELGPRHAEVLACLARIAESRGDPARATEHADHALAIFPMHRGAVAMRLKLAQRAGDSAMAAAMALRQLTFATSSDERVALLTETADRGLRVAIDAMQAALRIRPDDSALLDRLRAIHEATADWTRAVDVAVAAAEQVDNPRARALALVAAAEMSASRAKNVGRSVALYEAAISDDAEVPGAFEAIEKMLLDAGDFAGAERAYVRQLERLAGRGPAEAALLDKLARVREERLGDRRGAIQALDRLVSQRPDDVDALCRLASLLEANGEDGLSVKILEIAAQHAPGRVETFRDLARIHTRTGDLDRAYCAAGVLVQLGEADPEELLTYRLFAPELGVRPSQALDEATWRMLVPRELDGGALALLSALAPAAIDARIEQLRAKKALPSLDPREKQDVERTTVSAVRTAAWVAKLLGVPVPDIYVRASNVAGGFAVLPTREPALALGPSILSGRSVPELAFLFAREMAHMRMTGRLLVFYPELVELRGLVTAAISIAIGQSGSLSSAVVAVRQEMAKRLDPDALARVGHALRAIGDRGGQLDLLAWLRATERAACRVGLVACGDLSIAARVLSVDGRIVGGLSAADRLRDLVPFSVGPSYAEVRRTLGIASRTSPEPRSSSRPPQG